MQRTCLAALVLCIVGPLLSGCARPAIIRPRMITVIGHGRIHVRPDFFQLSAGISKHDKNLDNVRRMITETSGRVIDAARSFPIDVDRTRTTRFSVFPAYDPNTQEFRHYSADQDIEIYLRDLARGEDLTTEVLRAGATSVSIEFLAETGKDELLQQAREAAVKDAQQQAQRLARTLGERLGAAVQIGNPGDAYVGDIGGLYQMGQMGGNQGGYTAGAPTDAQSVTWLAPTDALIEAAVVVRFQLADGTR